MTNSTTGDWDGSGSASPARSASAKVSSGHLTPATEKPAPRRKPGRYDCETPLPAQPNAFSPLDRLSSMASLRGWEQRSTPALIHEAILGGASARDTAAAARLTVAEAHSRWGTWASRRLDPPYSRMTPGLTVQQFLNVHAAFTADLTHEDRAPESAEQRTVPQQANSRSPEPGEPMRNNGTLVRQASRSHTHAHNAEDPV